MGIEADAILRAISAVSKQLDELRRRGMPLTGDEMVELSRKLDRLVLEWYELTEPDSSVSGNS